MKSRIVCVYSLSDSVAPLVGAWIEIQLTGFVRVKDIVAPLVGAWIEILLGAVVSGAAAVAPLVGAWIEIIIQTPKTDIPKTSLPSWERGLKSADAGRNQASGESRSPRGSVD